VGCDRGEGRLSSFWEDSKISEPKKHHYVPQFLLRNFEDYTKKFYVFDKLNQKLGIRYISAKESFRQNHWNSTRDAKGVANTEIEHRLAILESETSPIISKIINAVRRRQLPTLTNDEAFTLAVFLCAQARRTPEARRNALRANDWPTFLREQSKIYKQKFGVNGNEIEDWLSDTATVNRIMGNAAVEATIKIGIDLLYAVLERGFGFAFINLQGRKFIVGSNPIVRFGNGLISDPGVEMWLPAAPDVLIGLGNGHQEMVLTSLEDPNPIRHINSSLAAQSNCIASESNDLLVSLVKRLRYKTVQ
jgi:hypothetical protein